MVGGDRSSRGLAVAIALILLAVPCGFAQPASPTQQASPLLPGLGALEKATIGKELGPISIKTIGGEEKPMGLIGGRVVFQTRVQVTYQKYIIESDRTSVDYDTGEIEGEGNVVFKGPSVDIRANAVRYNFYYDEGVAFGVEGHHGEFYFRVRKDEVKNGPAFRRISNKQVLLTGIAYTACDFPVPHYSIRGSEIIIYLGDRIFVRNAVVSIWGIPVLYLPVYTRSLVERSPWSFEAGYTNRLGGYLRIGYDYHHGTDVPDYFNPSKYRTRSHGQAHFNFDTFTRRGNGLGMDYVYKLDYGRHRGKFSAYGIRDEERDVPNEESTPARGALRWQHRSHLTDHLLFQLDIDQVTDPDIYFDILDHFENQRLGRRPERRSRFALTYAEDSYLVRLMADLRDRVTRNSYRDYSEPSANNLDYDPDPGGIQNGTIEGISGRRYAAASRKLPRFDFSTAHLKVWELPLYYDSDVHAFHALDKGLNPYLRDDNSWVDGIDWHQSVLHRLRLTDRYTWTNQLGMGVVYFNRQHDGLNADLPSGVTFPYRLDDLTLVNRDTWLTGERKRSFHDVEDGSLYYDYRSRLNARFSDTLEGYLQYTYRNVSSKSLGEFYRRIGDRTAQTDIYEFPVKTHMLEAFLNHFLLYPNISTYLRGGVNLHRESNIASYDLLNYVGAGTTYSNDTKEFTASLGMDLQERQIRDLTDPNEFQQSNLIYSGQVQYIPRHHRWWARLAVFAVQVLDPDPAAAPPSGNRFDENRTDVSISPLVGKRLGPKYTAELAGTYNTRIDDWQSVHLILKRDLHDLEAAVETGFRRVEVVSNNQLQVRRENEIRFSIRLKTPRALDQQTPTSTIQTLVESQLQTEFVQ